MRDVRTSTILAALAGAVVLAYPPIEPVEIKTSNPSLIEPVEIKSPASSLIEPVEIKRSTIGTTGEPRRFWVRDHHRYTSPWYAGARRKMIPFGCTRAPLYDPDPRCEHRHGFHHGLDIAMPCATLLFAAYLTRVVDPKSRGALGAAYGAWAFRLRSGRFTATSSSDTYDMSSSIPVKSSVEGN